MAGLAPPIHHASQKELLCPMDVRVKPGHDDLSVPQTKTRAVSVSETTRARLNHSGGDVLPRESRLAISSASVTAQQCASVTAHCASVDADGLQLVAPGIGDRCFPAIGQHD